MYKNNVFSFLIIIDLKNYIRQNFIQFLLFTFS